MVAEEKRGIWRRITVWVVARRSARRAQRKTTGFAVAVFLRSIVCLNKIERRYEKGLRFYASPAFYLKISSAIERISSTDVAANNRFLNAAAPRTPFV